MRKLLFTILLINVGVASAQQVILDPQHLAIVNENGAMRLSTEVAHKGYLKESLDRLGDIKLNLSAVILTEKMVLDGLTEVDQGLRDAIAIRQIGEMSAEIFLQSAELIELASASPALLLFAEQTCSQLKARGLRLVAEVGEVVLSARGDLLLDHQKRDGLLKKISLELKVIRAMIYSIKKCMYWAGVNGIFRTINPYRGFVNSDRALANSILLNLKTLKR